ncbi:hypothetical protein AB1471_02050 [Jeotgalibacillus marinus]|uniref:Uncharacterized protein n=1 Tax=Jeotgalibacillus marinus TaxID=86667 RepID=A0ABV3PZR2_9BACL
MTKRFSPKPLPAWWKRWRLPCQAVIIPICAFQAVRLFIWPSTLDVLLLGILVGVAVALYFEWI